MGVTKFPNGISSFGMPVLGGGSDMTTGSVFFVDSGTGSNSNSGLDPNHALATIDTAVGKCTASKGDIIYVMPGHNESLTAATSLVIDVAGISIIGLGRGRARPTLDYDNTAGTIEMDAASCRLSNIVLRASVAKVVVGVNVDADDCMIDGCQFTFESTTGDSFVTAVDVDAFDRAEIIDNVFQNHTTSTGANEGVRIDDAHNTRIIGNEFMGKIDTAAILNEGALCQNVNISHNSIYNDSTEVGAGIDLNTACTGMIAHNNVSTLSNKAEENIDPGSCGCIENYSSNAIDESGAITPPTLST